MSRISIDVTPQEHQSLKALAALQGQSIKEFVLSQTLGQGAGDEAALEELESLLRKRLRQAQSGAVSRKTVSQIFAAVAKKKPLE